MWEGSGGACDFEDMSSALTQKAISSRIISDNVPKFSPESRCVFVVVCFATEAPPSAPTGKYKNTLRHIQSKYLSSLGDVLLLECWRTVRGRSTHPTVDDQLKRSKAAMFRRHSIKLRVTCTPRRASSPGELFPLLAVHIQPQSNHSDRKEIENVSARRATAK